MRRLVALGGASDREGGQALIEFAAILPVFLLVMFGLVDVGRLVYTNATLSQAAREGARLAATEAAWVGITDAPACVVSASLITSANPGAHVCPPDVPTFKSNVSTAVQRMTTMVGPISHVHLSCNDGTVSDPAPSGAWTESSGGNGCANDDGDPVSSAGDQVSVRLEYTYQFFTPIITSFLGPVPLGASATMTIN